MSIDLKEIGGIQNVLDAKGFFSQLRLVWNVGAS